MNNNIFKQVLYFINDDYKLATSLSELRAASLHPFAEKIIEYFLTKFDSHSYTETFEDINDLIFLSISDLYDLNDLEIERLVSMLFRRMYKDEEQDYLKIPIDDDLKNLAIRFLQNPDIVSYHPFDNHDFTLLRMELYENDDDLQDVWDNIDVWDFCVESSNFKYLTLDKLTENENNLLLESLISYLDKGKGWKLYIPDIGQIILKIKRTFEKYKNNIFVGQYIDSISGYLNPVLVSPTTKKAYFAYFSNDLLVYDLNEQQEKFHIETNF